MSEKIIAFGDIHGCFKAASTAVSVAEELGATAIFLGDYVDRGESSMNTLKVLMEAKKNHSDWIFLRGNHDQMLLDLISGKYKLEDFIELEIGDVYYYLSEESIEEWNELNKKEQKNIESFLKSTLPYFENEHYIFTHAILRNTNQVLKEKSALEIQWNYDYEPFWDGKTFIHGHLAIDEIEYFQKGININTSCGYSEGYLSGLIIENGEVGKQIMIAPSGEFLV